jgi:hypothetical protein
MFAEQIFFLVNVTNTCPVAVFGEPAEFQYTLSTLGMNPFEK